MAETAAHLVARVQRFGGAPDLDVHFHVIVLDGVPGRVPVQWSALLAPSCLAAASDRPRQG